MKIIRSMTLFFTAAGVSLLCGCGILSMPEQQTISFCTLQSLRNEPSEYGLTAGRITNDSGANYKMRYQKGVVVIIDEYRQWADMPQIMLANILRTDFPAGNRTLNANIFCWETDITANQIRMGIEWQFDRKGVWHRNIYSAPLPELTPEAVAEAFSNAVRSWEDDIEISLAAVPEPLNR
jgi:hypothetical protein